MRKQKILFFKPGAIGDFLHTLPALGALKHKFPSAHITVVVSPGQDLLIQETSIANRVLVFDKVVARKSFRKFINFGTDLRRERYDFFIDMQPSTRSRILRILSGAGRRLVYRKQKRVRAGKQRLHAAENFMKTLEPLGIRQPVDQIRLPVRQESAKAAGAFLSSHGIRSRTRIVALNCSVGAARPSRNWFSDRFSELADRLVRELRATVIFIGGQEDSQLIQSVMKGMQEKAVSAAGKLNLAETAALLARCSCVVSSDTGPLHLATSVQTPVVGLFGSTDPQRTGPLGKNNRVLQKKISCVPCEKKNCSLPIRVCMQAISTDDVFSAVKDCIQ